MKPKYERVKNKKKLSKPLLIAIIVGGALFIAATVIFCVLWYNAIFNEQTLTIALMIVIILAIIGITGITWKLRK